MNTLVNTIRQNKMRRISVWCNLRLGIKAALDRIAAAAGLLCLSPLFIFLILSIRKDGGPAFYSQIRVGKCGKTFQCWKFRSMCVNADQVLADLLQNDPSARDEYEKTYKLKDDPRITKIGHFLRKYSLDELPQLWNIMRGDMSLVGPRPVVEDERKYYGPSWADYVSVKPGLTGLWQVSGRNDLSYAERVTLDTHYIQNWSLKTDCVILFKTISVVLNGRGAY